MEWLFWGVIIILVLKKLDKIVGGGKAPDKPTDIVDLYTEMENRRIQGQKDRKSLGTAAKVGAGVVAGSYGFKKGYKFGKSLL